MQRRRIKQPSTVTHTVPLPERHDEWNDFRRGEVVRIKGGHTSSVYWFRAYVVSPGGHRYVEVTEQQSANHRKPGPKLIRCFDPEVIQKAYVPKRRPARTTREAAALAARERLA